MRKVRGIPDSEEARARARLLAHFVDNPESVFYSRQLEVLFEDEYFHWITNRALRALVRSSVSEYYASFVTDQSCSATGRNSGIPAIECNMT